MNFYLYEHFFNHIVFSKKWKMTRASLEVISFNKEEFQNINTKEYILNKCISSSIFVLLLNGHPINIDTITRSLPESL